MICLVQAQGCFWAAGNAVSTANTGFRVDLWFCAASGHKPKANGPRIAMIFANPTLHRIQRQAGLRHGCLPRPGDISAQCAVFASCDAIAAKGASSGREIQYRKSGLVPGNDPFGASPRTITALGAGFSKGDIDNRAGWSWNLRRLNRSS